MFEKIDPKAKKIVYLQAILGIFVALCVGLIVTVLVMSRVMSTTASYTSLASSMQFASSTMSSTSADTHIDGSFHFYAEDGSVRIVGNLRGLAPNSEHGVYVIEFGDILRKSGSAFLNDALHFNPEAHTHGCPSSKEKHAGDLGNIKTDDQGVSTFDLRASWLQLAQIVGRAIVIGATKDDCKPTFKTEYIASGAIALSKSLELPVESKATVEGSTETDLNPTNALAAASAVSQPLQAPDSDSLSSIISPPFPGALAAASQITPEPAFPADSLPAAFKPSSIPDLASVESELTRDMNRAPTSSKSKRRKSVQDNIVSAPPPDPSSAILTSQLEPEPESRPIPALGMDDMSKLSTFGEEEEKAQQKLLQELNEKQKKMEEDQRHETERLQQEERRRKQEEESKRLAQEEMQLKAEEDKRKQEEKIKQQQQQQEEEEKRRKAEEEEQAAGGAALVKQQDKDKEKEEEKEEEEERTRKNKAVQTAKDKLEHDPDLANEVQQGETISRNKKKKHRRKHSKFEDFDPFGPPDSSLDSTTDSISNQPTGVKSVPTQVVPTSPAPGDATLSFPFLGGQNFGGSDDNPFQKLLQSLQQPQNNKVAPFSPEASTVMPRFLTNQIQDGPFPLPFQQSAPPLPETEEQLTDPDDVGSNGSNNVDPFTSLLGSGIRRTDSS
eukprot:GILJ01005849.1.p1 GENE.GILJ01005849.1~~GILJ01005849.1.p1  ORF type:complete len:669 (+),score=158.92 GILJ01005849.1:136-2142(+)